MVFEWMLPTPRGAPLSLGDTPRQVVDGICLDRRTLGQTVHGCPGLSRGIEQPRGSPFWEFVPLKLRIASAEACRKPVAQDGPDVAVSVKARGADCQLGNFQRDQADKKTEQEGTMNAAYHLDDPQELLSPSLIVFREVLLSNLRKMIALAGDVRRLRPHCKTHKMAAVTRLELEWGITKHKCATLAEAEMLAEAGVKDIFLAYNLVGPNIRRGVQFVQRYPQVQLAVTADDARMIEQLGQAVQDLRARQPQASLGVLLDLDPGLHRTGVSDPALAAALYQQIVETPGLRPEGFHLYDGHNHQTDLSERRAAVLAGWDQARRLRDEFVSRGWPVPRMVCGGTGSFPIFASLSDPAIELAPGTCVFHDSGYAATFPDLDFEPAALLFTRVVSRPTVDRLTCDLGNKAVAADPPKGQRVVFPDLPDAQQVIHNEEHLVLQTPAAARYRVGDTLLAIPRHVCPTSALYKWVYVAEGGRIVDRWEVTARDRQLTI